jgi:hypothetical protein
MKYIDDKGLKNRFKLLKKEAVLKDGLLFVIVFKLQNQMLKFAVHK